MRLVEFIKIRPFNLFLLVTFFSVLGLSADCLGMGMGWGDWGSSNEPEVVGCVPDDPMIIMPGPFGSPLRISADGPESYLVADYLKRAIYRVDAMAPPERFIETGGKPLSVAYMPAFFQ